MTYALDVSNHGGVMSRDQWAAAWHTRGVRRAIFNTYDQGIARAQIEEVVATGLPWDLQTYRYHTPAWRRELEEDERFIADIRSNLYNIQKHWLDYEDGFTHGTLRDRIAAIHAHIDFWTNKCHTGLYTRPSYWREAMGDTKEFTFMPLWMALFNGRDELEIPAEWLFGGWTTCEMHQTLGDVMVAGISCDSNYYIAPPPPDPEPVAPTVEIYRDTIQITPRGLNGGSYEYDVSLRFGVKP